MVNGDRTTADKEPVYICLECIETIIEIFSEGGSFSRPVDRERAPQRGPRRGPPHELTSDVLQEIVDRVDAALAVVAPPWLPLRATKDGIGGQSFIQGGDPVIDHEIYLTVMIEGHQLSEFSDPRVDDLIEFIGQAPGDIQRLVQEIRRLRRNDLPRQGSEQG